MLETGRFVSAYSAHREWATRAPDECYDSVPALHAAATRIAAASFELSTTLPNVVPQNAHILALTLPDGSRASFSHWAFGQLCATVSAPAHYLRTLPAHVTAQALNHELARRARAPFPPMVHRRIAGSHSERSIMILRELVLSYRPIRDAQDHRITCPSAPIRDPATAVPLLMQLLASEPQEVIGVLHLNMQCDVLGWRVAAPGTLDAAMVTPREIFQAAMLINARSIILAHVHPSGHCEPSAHDIALTHRLKQAGTLLDIDVVDHRSSAATALGAAFTRVGCSSPPVPPESLSKSSVSYYVPSVSIVC